MAINKVSSYNIDEILHKVESQKTKEDKVKALRAYNTLALRNILKGALDDEIVFTLPEGEPPFRKANQHTPYSNLKKQSIKFKYFVVGGAGEKLSKLKVESMFIKVLEAIPPSEARVAILMKDKQLHTEYPSITKEIVVEAFPGLIEG
jgi:hypothetical protein